LGRLLLLEELAFDHDLDLLTDHEPTIQDDVETQPKSLLLIGLVALTASAVASAERITGMWVGADLSADGSTQITELTDSATQSSVASFPERVSALPFHGGRLTLSRLDRNVVAFRGL